MKSIVSKGVNVDRVTDIIINAALVLCLLALVWCVVMMTIVTFYALGLFGFGC